MKMLIMAIAILTNLITGTGYGEVIESGFHLVGASIEPGYYLINVKANRNINSGNTVEVSMSTQPPNPEDEQINKCTIIAYSDYWTESRGLSILGGWGIFKIRQGDYAIYTDCPMIKVPKNYSPQTPFTQTLLSG